MEKLSKYLSYAEGIRSDTATKYGLDNKPSPEHLLNMKNIATKIFDPVREHVGGPLFASSFYRSPKLNEFLNKTKGLASKTSQHMKGEAIDITTKRYNVGTNRQVFEFIKDNLNFDQLIWEFGDDNEPAWVHVSLKRTGTNRKSILKAILVKNKPVYIPYVADER